MAARFLIVLSQKFYFDRYCEQWLLLLTEKLKYFSLISFNIIKYKQKKQNKYCLEVQNF